MAVLEAFQRSDSSLVLDAASLVVGTPTSSARLAPSDAAAASSIALFSSAPGESWCPEGQTRLLVLARQAIGGPLPTAPAVWSAAARTQALAVFRAIVRTAAADETASACLLTACDALAARDFTLGPAVRAGVFERMLTTLPGDACDPPISRFLSAALPRVPWLACAVLDRPGHLSVENAVAELLTSHGRGSGPGSITKNNLIQAESKAQLTLSSPGKPGSNRYERVRDSAIATHASTGPSGEIRARYDHLAYEAVVRRLTGDSAEDMTTLLRSGYSVIRRLLNGKPFPTATELLNRATALAPSFSAFAARAIVNSKVCGAAASSTNAVLSDAHARSILDGSIFTNIKTLCAPLAQLKARPFAEFTTLAAHGGIPSYEAVMHMYEGYGDLLDALGYNEWGPFCKNLLYIRSNNEKAYMRITEMYDTFLSQDLRNVREQVHGGYNSSTLDNKMHVSFGCADALQTLADSDDALKAVGQQARFGLFSLEPPAPAATAAPSSRKAGKQPAGAAATSKPAGGALAPAPSGKRREPSTGRPTLKVDIRGDKILTPLFEYATADVEKAFGRPMDQICGAVVLRADGRDSDCPDPSRPGHGPGGPCHDFHGVDPKTIPKKSRRTDNGDPASKRRFGGPARK
jgi:hypothetical protein